VERDEFLFLLLLYSLLTAPDGCKEQATSGCYACCLRSEDMSVGLSVFGRNTDYLN
jgi:hypothetical protein